LNAASFGTPQRRLRVIVIGVRRDLGVAPSHPVGRVRAPTARQALFGARAEWAPTLADKYGRFWDRVPAGGTAGQVPELRAAGCWKASTSTHKLHPDRVAPTLCKTQGGRGFATVCHWAAPRALTVAEALRLAGFPDDFVLPEIAGDRLRSYRARWARVGNCVPPPLARAVAEHVRGLLAQADARLVSSAP
jgi:DNA (cytosine-5)-methyltransferase 1